MQHDLPAWKILLFTAVFGPPVGLIIVLMPALREIGSYRDLAIALGVAYGVGLVPSLLGAILFVALRSRLGSGYMTAALCGWVGTFIAVMAFWLSTGVFDILPALVAATVGGILPALVVRGMAHVWLPEDDQGPEDSGQQKCASGQHNVSDDVIAAGPPSQ